MHRVVSFYEALPRGPAPEVKPRGLIGRYQARYFGKNPSRARRESELFFDMMFKILIIVIALIHAIVFFMAFGYAQNYYFHLRMLYPCNTEWSQANSIQVITRTMLIEELIRSRFQGKACI